MNFPAVFMIYYLSCRRPFTRITLFMRKSRRQDVLYKTIIQQDYDERFCLKFVKFFQLVSHFLYHNR